MNVILLLAFVTAASAHMCLLNPTQRGTLNGINKAAAPDCIRLAAPCGQPISAPSETIKSGVNFTVTFQKNLDHWLASSPGYFTVGVATSAFERYTELVKIQDKGEPALTLYLANINIPSSMRGQAIVQVQYVTKNPQAPPVFYQCADVNVA